MKIFAEPVIPPGFTSCESDEFNLSDAPVSLQITPDDWKLSPKIDKKIQVRCLKVDGPQDVIVTCRSFFFEIKNFRAKYEIFSQVFHVMQEGDIFEFVIGLKSKNEDTSKTVVTLDHKEYGYISFSYYPSLREDDSDESWNLDGTKLLVRIWKPQVHIHGHRMQYLELSEKTEETKRREDLLGMMKIQSPYEENIKQAEVKDNFGRGKKKKKGKCTVQ